MAVDAPLPFSQRITARQWLLLDVAFAAVTAAATIAAIVTGRHGGPSGSGWDVARVVATFAAFAALPFRRAYPGQVLAAATVLAAVLVAVGVHGPVTTVVALAVYTVAADTDRRASPETVGTVVAVIAVGALVAHGGPDWGAALSGPAVALVGWFAGVSTRTRRAYSRAVVEQTAEREREREERVRRAAADERVRIARELHDVVAHAMSVIAVRSGVARVVLNTQPDEARDALAIIETTSRQALQEMRLIVGVLRNPDDPSVELGPAPGLNDLDELIERIGEAGVRVQTRVEGTIRPLPAGMDLSAYRIIQEALTNVVRHAGPTTAQLRLRYRPDDLEIELTDAGASQGEHPSRQSPPNGSGHGLAGMRERVALYGGQLSAEPTSRGFKVVARLPTGEHRQ